MAKKLRKDVYRKSRKILEVSLIMMAIMFGYNNCGQQFKTGSGMTSSSESSSKSSLTLTGDLCEDQILTLFANSYHSFLKENCALCHSSGPGKGRFANPDTLIAYNDFFQIGYTKVSNNAISVNHNPPYTGPQHIQVINEFKLQWQKGQEDYASCKGVSNLPEAQNIQDVISLETVSKVIPTMDFGQSKKISYNLVSELGIISGRAPSLPSIPGAMLSILVGKNKTSGGDTYYTFSNPTLYGSSVDVRVKGIHIKINGRLQKYPTTFRFVDAGIPAGSKDDSSGLISTGSIVIPGVPFAEDQASLAFELIERTVVPPPPPPVTVSLGNATYRTVNGHRYADIPVNLSSISTVPITVSVDTNEGSTGMPNYDRARGLISGTQTFYRFDWDYKFIGTTSATFLPLETSKTITVELSTDIRKEAKERLLTLKIASVSSSASVGSPSSLNISIIKTTNPTPTIGVPTYSELMESTTGILGQNCVKCHNSEKIEGGYNMTDYMGMTEKGVLNLANPVSSKMFRRMDADDPGNQNLSPMPLDGFMTQSQIRKVKQWISDGAKNN